MAWQPSGSDAETAVDGHGWTRDFGREEVVILEGGGVMVMMESRVKREQRKFCIYDYRRSVFDL